MTRRPNQLAGETSPYLLQHLYNPVDWNPWGPAALERARREDRPIFLSIGYAACHWCHVMERESFENPAIATFLNEHFVSIKVDREERPDLDEIYMSAVQLMTGQGGWPLSAFLTPTLEPFFGGTYFPPESRGGRIGFLDLLGRIDEAWSGRRDEIEVSARRLTDAIRAVAERAPGDDVPGLPSPADAVRELAARFDPHWGGFGAAPKFPPDQALALLLRADARGADRAALGMAGVTLDRMANGGIYDHVGGGFARYSVDERWLVPHFEKMLYSQALLVPVYTDAWVATGHDTYRRTVHGTTDFVRREMTSPEGGLYSSLDADSEGVEGKFYVWKPSQVREVLGPLDAERWCAVYGITEDGNFEGDSIPNLLARSLGQRAEDEGIDETALVAALEPLRGALLEARATRIRPGTDDKILTAWNGLMVTAFCRAAQAFGRAEDLRSARDAATFVLDRLIVDGRLRVTWRAGEARLNAYLDDHAFLARGLVDLYETTFERRWLDAAAELGRTLLSRFEDRERGGFFFVSDDHEALLTRTRTVHDGALPSGSGVATEALSRLGHHLDDARFRGAARAALAASAAHARRSPSAHASILLASDWESDDVRQIGIVGHEAGALVARVRRRAWPPPVLAVAPTPDDTLPLLRARTAGERGAVAYVCRGTTCDAPTDEPTDLDAALDRV